MKSKKADKTFHPIGSTFFHEDVELEVVRFTPSTINICNGCFFDDKTTGKCNCGMIYKCAMFGGSDNTDVIYKEIK